MKILLLASFSEIKGNFGGAERVLTNLANFLAENTNNRIILFSVEGNYKAYKTSEKVVFESLGLTKNNKILRHLQILKNTKIALKKYDPDIIISFSIQPIFYAIILKLFSKIRFFYSERNDPKLEYGLIARIMRWFVMKKSDGIVFQTNEAMNYFSNDIKKKSVVIHNPVSIDENKYPIPDLTDNRIVCVGRLYPQKNHKLLINAFDRIKDLYPEITLEIYGDGILREELQSYIDSMNLNKRVFLKHSRPDVLDCIYGARLFVLPSLYEGIPNTLMEAMALGIPVISSDCPCGGPRELIEDGINGYLFKNNDLNDLVNKIKIIMNYNYPKQMCEEAIKIYSTHSYNIIFNKWINYINMIINKSRLL